MTREDPTKNGEVDILISKVYGTDSRNNPTRVLFGAKEDDASEVTPTIEIRNAANGELLKSFGGIIKSAIYDEGIKGSIYKWGMFKNISGGETYGTQIAGSEKFAVLRRQKGVYDISFIEPMPTTSYFVLGSAESTVGRGVECMATYNQTATSVRIDWGYHGDSSSYAIDPNYWNFAIVCGENVF